MGGRGASYKSTQSKTERFEYKRSADLKEWSEAEERRNTEHTKLINDKIFTGGWQEYYEEKYIEDIETFKIDGAGYRKDDEVIVGKMVLVNAQNWDENDRRVKQGKAVTGTTYYVVQDSDGSTDETHWAYKTKTDAIHAAKLYADRQNKYNQWAKKRYK